MLYSLENEGQVEDTVMYLARVCRMVSKNACTTQSKRQYDLILFIMQFCVIMKVAAI